MKAWLRRVPPVARFALVGISGTVPNLLIIWLLVDVGGLNYIAGLIAGAQAGVIWNFLLTDRFVFPHRRERSVWSRAWRFAFVGNMDLLVRLPLTAFLIETWQWPAVPAAAAVIAVVFMAKWLLVSRVIWRPRPKR